MYYDIIIIGGGIAGLYCAYNIKKYSPKTTFLILEKHKKQWLGGRIGTEDFYGTSVVTGAGIGRFEKDTLLKELMNELHIPYKISELHPNYSFLIKHPIEIIKIIRMLKKEYNSENDSMKTFKKFALPLLGNKYYNDFIVSVGYTDYEHEDAYDTLYHYGMEDNEGGWNVMNIKWKNLINALVIKIGVNNIKTNTNIVNVSKTLYNKEIKNDFNGFVINSENNDTYLCKKVVIATTITSIQKLLPEYSIYKNIVGQPFLRLYGKFDKSSIYVMKQYIQTYTIVPGPLQKIIPIDENKGVYMIAYSDNKNALFLKPYLTNTLQNRDFFCRIIEKSLGIPKNLLHLIAIKEYYWPIGTHYYKPLNKKIWKSRNEFIREAQIPDKKTNIFVVGEVVSINQGWTEGALESVSNVISKLI